MNSQSTLLSLAGKAARLPAKALWIAGMVSLAAFLARPLAAQTCLEAADMDPATRAALINTAQRYFTMATQGDVASLRQNAIPALAGNFAGIEAAVVENKPILAGVTPAARSPYLLKAEGTVPIERAEFLCGVFAGNGQTANSAVFIIPNLPPGDYGFVVLDAATSKGAQTVSFVLQQDGAAWKLAGFYVKPSQAAGHDGAWFATKARDFKAKGQMRNAWLYSTEARDLLVPVPFMSTQATDRLYDEFHDLKPSDFPPSELTVGQQTVKIITAFLLPVEQQVALIVRFESADVSKSDLAYQDNLAVIRALVAKYPELRDAFDAIVARGVEPSGRDFGTLQAMKDVK